MTTRTVAILAYDGAQVLDVMGPAEVFYAASEIHGGGAYRAAVVSVDGRDVTSASGQRIGVGGPLADAVATVDTLIVPGSDTWAEAMGRGDLIGPVAATATRARRVAGVCAGAFLLGAAGLLDGRRATTHWLFLDELERCFPATRVERDPIFVADWPVFTSAGGTAGIDLALAMVEADLGAHVAREVARFLVVFMQRPGSHAQFSARLSVGGAAAEGSQLRPLLDAIAADPAADHRLAALSDRAGFSERHLARVFARELGTTPARYVERIRLEAARAMLESSDSPLEAIARECGLGSAETLRRTFHRELSTTPHAYRQRFRTTGVAVAAV